MPVAVTLPDCRGGPLEIVDKPELVPRPGGLKDTLLVQRPPFRLHILVRDWQSRCPRRGSGGRRLRWIYKIARQYPLESQFSAICWNKYGLVDVPSRSFPPVRRTMTIEEVEEQIERCRRIASVMTDDDIRHSLEDLAEEYEAQLPRKRRSFMLGGSSPLSGSGGA